MEWNVEGFLLTMLINRAQLIWAELYWNLHHTIKGFTIKFGVRKGLQKWLAQNFDSFLYGTY
jgi:hypothetical protein